MFQNVTPEYMKFIKNYIINQLYFDYCRLVNENYPQEELRYALLENSSDAMIWEEIFKKHNTALQYYIQLFKQVYSDGIPYQKEATVFETKTFQEYIDGIINISSIGAYDYQNFIASMRNNNFRNNTIKKYTSYTIENTIKNNLVYVLKLYLYEKLNEKTYFTDEELEDIETSLNMVPYFEYVSKRNSRVDINESERENMNDYYFEYLEKTTLDIINKSVMGN